MALEEIQSLAVARGGECLSTSYRGAHVHLQWRCAEGHEWKASPHHVRNSGQWCPECGRVEAAKKRRSSIDCVLEVAAARGGECLSSEYVNTRTKMRWRCADGHEWEATPSNVKNGSWCSVCARVALLTIDKMHSLAASRGGECLSSQYVNNRTRLRWRCADGHEWEATPANVRKGTWCPFCAVDKVETGVGEATAVEVISEITGLHFKKARPAWLVNADGRRLELDAYCEERKVAFEYQGAMHHRYMPFFHSSPAHFARIRRHDSLKRKLCAEHGVLLIQMPEVARPTPEKIRAALVRLCEAMAFPIELNPEYAAMVGASRARMDSETPSD